MKEEIINSFFNDLRINKRKPDFEFVHEYKGFGIHNSECKVEIWTQIMSDRKNAVILFTDLGKGTSVTNASEQIVTEIWQKCLPGLFHQKDCLFLETYDGDKNNVDIVVPTWSNENIEKIIPENKCIKVTWKHLGKMFKD